MMTINLPGLRFYARHGLYAEEKLLPNLFEVSVSIRYEPMIVPLIQLDHAVDYEKVFAIISERMQQPADLLETIATEIAAGIRSGFEEVLGGSVTIKKLHVPVKGWFGPVEVSYSW